MYEAQIRLEQEKPCILSELAREYGSGFDVHIEELHDHKVSFLLSETEQLDEYHQRLLDSDHVDRVERIDDETLAITKPSCGAYGAVYENHGTLRRLNQISDAERVYSILFFDRDDLRAIVRGFREIGNVSLLSLTEVGKESDRLTARQREVVEAALESGYFEWPRETSSEELAAEFDVNRATVLEHLRKAEAKLIEDAL